MRSTFIAILCLFSQVLSAQVWQWSHQIGGPSSEGVRLIGTDASAAIYIYGGYSGGGGLYIGQDTLHSQGVSAFIAKFSSDGTLLWVRNCTSPNVVGINSAVLDTVANKLYVAGVYINSCILDTCALSAQYSGGFLSQWDLDGHCLWARNAVTSGPDLANRFCNTTTVTVDQQGQVFVGGYTTPYGPNYLAGQLVPQGTYMSAYSAAGDTIWTRMIAYYHGDLAGFTPACSRVWQGHVFVSNLLYLHTTLDTVTVDTVIFTGLQGAALALLRLDQTDGSMDWVNANGFPYVGPNVTQDQLNVDPNGHLFVTGGFGDGSVFGTDTLSVSGFLTGGGYLAEFNADGVLQWVRAYEASGGAYFSGLDRRSNGNLDVTGWIRGTAIWDGVSYTAEKQSVLIASFSPTGQCLGIEAEVGPALGNSIVWAPDGLYLAGTFPPLSPPVPPFEPITIGNDTYNTFGGKDAFIAKHSLATSIAYRSMPVDGLHIYANPNRGSFQLEMPDAFANERDLVLRIYDSTGRMVLEQPMDMTGEAVHLDVFDAVPGFYNVTLTNGRRSCSGSMVVE